eukprot:755677-Hanusia_phi.AAC.3
MGIDRSCQGTRRTRRPASQRALQLGRNQGGCLERRSGSSRLPSSCTGAGSESQRPSPAAPASAPDPPRGFTALSLRWVVSRGRATPTA